jgi:two-component system, sensor histidine kinase and response regulator
MDISKKVDPIKLIVVDDHPNTAAMLARVLSKFDTPVEIKTASGGEEALEIIGDQGVDILITDFMMPGMNGLELIESLTGSQKPAHIILITAYDTPGLEISARKLNVQDYLVKPVQPENIRGLVGKAIDGLRPSPVAWKPAGFQRKFKILVADDNPDSLRLLSSRLQNEGYIFIPSWNGEETLEKTRSEKPDLILLDVNMPKKNGFEVLEEIRADSTISHIPVIVISAARIGPKDIRDGFSLGADDYVIKPFDWRELAVRIQSKLRVKQAEDILRRRNLELETIHEISRELVGAGTIEDVANIILSRINHMLDAAWARVDILQGSEYVFNSVSYFAASSSSSQKLFHDHFTDLDILALIKTDHRPKLVEDTRSEPAFKVLEEAGIGSLLVMPLLYRDSLVGILSISNGQPTRLSEERLAFVQTIASQTALAVENIHNQENKSQIAQNMDKEKTYLLEMNNDSNCQGLLEQLPQESKQISGEIS